MYQIWKESIHEKGVFGWLKVTFVKQYEEENGAIFSNTYLMNYLANFLDIWYVELHIIEGIKCVNLIELAQWL